MSERQEGYGGQGGQGGQSGQEGQGYAESLQENNRDGHTVPGDAMYVAELERLQKVDFALVELTLYLDTHPNDLQALQQFNQLTQYRMQIAQAFEIKYGPLLQFGHSFSRYPWQWSQTPWPWQV